MLQPGAKSWDEPSWSKGYNARVRAPFEIIEHPADVGFLAQGATLEELFANAALAMMSLACALECVEEREQREIIAHGSDTEALLYDWLTEILAVADAEQLVFCRAEVNSFSAGEIRGIVHGEKFDKSRHQAGTYIKAVTYHQLRIEQTPGGWHAQVFLDV
jgi:protein archease